MNRRKAIKIAAGAIAGSGAGIFILSSAFKPDNVSETESRKLEHNKAGSDWPYSVLDPDETANIAYEEYKNGSCMYAVFKSVAVQLVEKSGKSHLSFPYHIMKYGHGGVGGYGTICGALNGASALIGLFVSEKTHMDSLINGLFKWYEKSNLPEYNPAKPILTVDIPVSTSNSVLCHASITNWSNSAGYGINSNERKERCRRLTSEVAAQITVILNKYFGSEYVTSGEDNEGIRTCLSCHGKDGKLDNAGGKMDCSSCHTESLGHKVFSDVHYRLMKNN